MTLLLCGGICMWRLKKGKKKKEIPPKRKHETTVCILLFSQISMPFTVKLYYWTLSMVASSLLCMTSAERAVLTRGEWAAEMVPPPALLPRGAGRCTPSACHGAPTLCAARCRCRIARDAQPSYPLRSFAGAWAPSTTIITAQYIAIYFRTVCFWYVSRLSEAIEYKEILGCFSPCLRLLKAAEVCLDLDDAMSSLLLGTLVLESHTSTAIPLYRAGGENRTVFHSCSPFQGKCCLHPEIFPFLVRNFCFDKTGRSLLCFSLSFWFHCLHSFR